MIVNYVVVYLQHHRIFGYVVFPDVSSYGSFREYDEVNCAVCRYVRHVYHFAQLAVSVGVEFYCIWVDVRLHNGNFCTANCFFLIVFIHDERDKRRNGCDSHSVCTPFDNMYSWLFVYYGFRKQKEQHV